MPCLLALAAAMTTASPAQTAPALAASAPAADAASIQAPKDRGAYLLTLKRFGVAIEHSGEHVLQDGRKLQHGASASMDAAQPTASA